MALSAGNWFIAWTSASIRGGAVPESPRRPPALLEPEEMTNEALPMALIA